MITRIIIVKLDRKCIIFLIKIVIQFIILITNGDRKMIIVVTADFIVMEEK